MREAMAVVHKADPAQAGSLRGHRSSYFLGGPRGALSHTTAGAGADPSLRPTTLIAVPCFPPSPPLYLSALRLRQVLAPAPAAQPAPPGH